MIKKIKSIYVYKRYRVGYNQKSVRKINIYIQIFNFAFYKFF